MSRQLGLFGTDTDTDDDDTDGCGCVAGADGAVCAMMIDDVGPAEATAYPCGCECHDNMRDTKEPGPRVSRVEFPGIVIARAVPR